jgi:hypothetical protein
VSDQPITDLAGFAKRLIQLTEEGRINWEPTGDDGFAYVGSRASVVIRSQDKDQRHPFILSILDGDVEADSLKSGWDAESEYEEGPPLTWNDDLQNLYGSARRSAFKIDVLIASILEEVEKDDE